MKKLLPALLVLLIFPAISQLFVPGFFVSDDGEWMIIRFTSFYQELIHFQIPVRYLHRLNNGYGYPVATFLYPGFMYLASVFKIIGFGFIAAIKGVLVLSICGAFFGMYLFLKNHFSKWSALIGSVLYIYNPYFLWDVYKRGSVGEVLALSIVPFILYFIDRERRVIASLLTAFLIISHNTLALLFLPAVLLYLLINQFSKKVSFPILCSRVLIYFLLTLGVSAFFWVPAVFELPYTVFNTIAISNFSEYFVSDFALVGIINIIVLVVAIIYIAINRKYSLVLFLMLGIALISLFLSLPFSSIFWSDGLFGRYVQFPFRFLSLFAVATAYLGAFSFSPIKYKIAAFAVLVMGFIVVSAYPFISKVERKDVVDTYYSTNVDTTTVKNEYMPVWVKNLPLEIANPKIERINENTIQINTIYWPGHVVKVDGEITPIDYSSEQGVMRVATTSPTENIMVVFTETKLRVISDVISILSVVGLSLLLFKKMRYV